MISLYLMGLKGYLVLEKTLTEFGKDFINCVVSSRDEGVQNDYYMDILNLCKQKGIDFFNRRDDYVDSGRFRIAIGWKWLLKDTKGLIVLHDSLLPNYRGFNPLVTALIEGDTVIGVTALWAGKNYDEGDIIFASSRKIEYPIKVKQVIEIVAESYCEICLQIFTEIKAGRKLNATPQDDRLASYSLWRDEIDYRIDWTRDADYIKRFIDAVGFPYKGAMSRVNDKSIRIIEAGISEDIKIINRCGGKVFRIENQVVYVVCGKGILKITGMEDDANGLPFLIDKVRTRFV